MYLLLLALIYLAFISLGLPDSLLGAGWPVMHQALQVPVAYMGMISMVISLGTIVSSLLSDRLTHKLGTQVVVVASVFLTAIALLGFSLAGEFWLLIVFAVPYGLGAGAIDAALNNYVALHYTSRHMSWLHCFWGVGAIVSPFIMSAALRTSNWQSGYRAVFYVQLVIAVILLATLPVWRVNADTSTRGAAVHLGLIGALKLRGVPTLLVAFFAYCALESTAMGWASTYLVAVKSVTTAQAARYAALFYIGITVGRFVGGFIMNRLGDHNMIRLGAVILASGVVLLGLAPARSMMAVAALLIIGLGCAPIYPCIIHATPSNFGRENSGAIVGIQMASAYVGTTFIPPLFGVVGTALNFAIMPVYILGFLVLMVVMIELTFKLTASRPSGHAS